MKAEEFRTLLERATAGDKEAVEATGASLSLSKH